MYIAHTYIELKEWRWIKILFRYNDSKQEGLLMFAGMFEEDDFISLAVVQSNVILRYSGTTLYCVCLEE